MKYRPTSEDKKIIHECAQKAAHREKVTLAMGSRYNVTLGGQAHFNLLLVSANWHADTDLDDFAPWSAFASGVELTCVGNAEVDFYVTEQRGELRTNIQAHVRDGKLVRVTEGRKILWGE